MSDGTTKGAWFAWERGLKGPIPIKFHDGINSTDAKRLLTRYQIEPVELLESFGALAKKYPPPAPTEDDLWQNIPASP